MKRTIWVIILLIIVVIVAVFMFRSPSEEEVQNGSEVRDDDAAVSEGSFRTEPSESENGNNAGDEETSNEVVTVTYTAGGFESDTVTIEQGEQVRWVNESGSAMWIATDLHPSHAEYEGTTRSEHCPDEDNSSFDQCETGDVYTFTFDKAGEWGYHNHVNASHGGTVIVE